MGGVKNKKPHHTLSNRSKCWEEFIDTGVGRGFQDGLGGATGRCWADGWLDGREWTVERVKERWTVRGLKDKPEQIYEHTLTAS